MSLGLLFSTETPINAWKSWENFESEGLSIHPYGNIILAWRRLICPVWFSLFNWDRSPTWRQYYRFVTNRLHKLSNQVRIMLGSCVSYLGYTATVLVFLVTKFSLFFLYYLDHFERKWFLVVHFQKFESGPNSGTVGKTGNRYLLDTMSVNAIIMTYLVIYTQFSLAN